MNSHCAERLREITPLSPPNARASVAARHRFVLSWPDDAGAAAPLAAHGRLLLAPADMGTATPTLGVTCYDGFGNRTAEDNAGDLAPCDGSTDVSASWCDTPLEQDVDTDLLHAHTRCFDPSLGRWTAEDPVRYAADDLNLCRYVRSHSSPLPGPDADTPQP
jgi:RHS repeat-associated protein